MSQQITYSTQVFTGHQAKRLYRPSASVSSMSSSSCTWISGPYTYDYNGCTGFTATLTTCGLSCVSTSTGEAVQCPSCVYGN